MKKEYEKFIELIDTLPNNVLFIKETGRDVVDFPQHHHAKHQIIYTLFGTLRIEIGDTSYFVPERHIAWIPPNTEHKLSSYNHQISLQMIYWNHPNISNDSFAVFRINTFISENIKFIVRNIDFVKFNEHPEIYNYSISFLSLLPAMGMEYQTPLSSILIPEDIRLKGVLDFILNHLQDDLSMERVASQFGFSVRNLSRLFLKFGSRFTQYVNYQRVTRAIELLADRDKSIEQIAYEVGFSSPNTFNRVFKQIIGTSPTLFCKTLLSLNESSE
ncbi:MAG: AraC family transcriptional regulator [Bacteroides sp.]|nr:AraC family transcriptional regulator [Bacteroides sp.]